MNRFSLIRPILAGALALLPVAGFAGGPAASAEEPTVAYSPTMESGALTFTVRGGLSVTPEYFGSSDYKVGPDIGLSFNHLRLRDGREFGGKGGTGGFGLHGSVRFIGKRSTASDPALAGLSDVDAALELGMGVGYSQQNFETFANLRYGVVGHHSFVGDLGANLVMRPSDRMTVRFGPRVALGSDRFADTYFSVPAAASSPTLPAFSARGGVMSAGLELGVTYAVTDVWGVEGAVTWNRLLNDAADSPITQNGDADQYGVRIGLTRKISLNF